MAPTELQLLARRSVVALPAAALTLLAAGARAAGPGLRGVPAQRTVLPLRRLRDRAARSVARAPAPPRPGRRFAPRWRMSRGSQDSLSPKPRPTQLLLT